MEMISRRHIIYEVIYMHCVRCCQARTFTKINVIRLLKSGKKNQILTDFEDLEDS